MRRREQIMKTFIKTTGAFALAATLFLGGAALAFAYSFNDGAQGQDCPTVTVARSNNSPTTGYGCWYTSDTATDGNIVTFAIYYHNTSSSPVSNVSVFIDNPGSSTQQAFTLSGGIKVGGQVVKTGSATISLDHASRLEFNKATNEYNGGVNEQVISGTQLMGSGYNVGTLEPGWADQGVAKISFKVVSDGTSGATPSVITGGATVSGSTASVSGTVSSNGANVSTWFEWGLGNTNSATSHTSRGNVNTSFQELLTGLSNGTYSYRACAENTDNTSLRNCGTVKHFTISSGTIPTPTEQVPVIDTIGADPSTTSAVLRGRVSSTGNPTGVTYYFEYGTSSGNLNHTTSTGSTNSDGFEFSRTASGLSQNTTYWYRACGYNSAGTDCGSILSFSTNDDGTCYGCNNNQYPVIETVSATSTGTNSATLQGRVVDTGSPSNVTYYFKYGTSYGYLNQTTSYGYTSSDYSDFSRSISGLSQNTTYWYQACGYNSTGSDCGNILSFTTNYNQNPCDIYPYCTNPNPPVSYQRPSVTTLGTLNRGGTYAVLDGYYAANGCSVSTWFEYGTTQNFGQRSVTMNRGNASGSMAQFVSDLLPNTTYYYRAAAQNCNGTAYGNTLTFTTTTDAVTPPPTNVITRVVTVATGGGGSNMIRLTIDNHQEQVSRGQALTYDVTWENISGKKLEDLVLEVDFQKELHIDRTRDGKIDDSENSVVIDIRELDIAEKDDTSIDTTVRGGLADGDPVVARAIMAFENPTTRSQENAIAYDSDEFRGTTGLGASLFGLDFLPNSLAGWLLILILLIAIVLLARHYMNQGKVVTTVTTSAPAVPPQQPSVSVTPNPYTDYPPYRPTPKQ